MPRVPSTVHGIVWCGGGLVLAIPAAALLAFAPEHTTRFHPLKAALAAVALVPALYALRPLWRPRLFARPGARPVLATWLGLAFMGWAAVSLAWSPAPGSGLLTLTLLCVGGVYLLLLTAWLEAGGSGPSPGADPRGGVDVDLEGRARRAVRIWLLAGLAAAGLAVAQRAGSLRLGLHRVTGPVGNPNDLAAVLVVLLPAAFVALRPATRARARRHAVARAMSVAPGVAGLFALLAGIWATGCHAAWVAVAGMAALAALTAPARPAPVTAGPRARPVRRLARLALVLGAVALAAVGTLSAPARSSLAGRWQLARVSADVVADAPLVGVGLGGYATQAAWSQGAVVAASGGPWAPLRDAHHQGLQLAAELGVVGLVLGLALLVSLLWPLWRRRREPRVRAALIAWAGLLVLSLSQTVLARVEVLLFACGWLAVAWAGARAGSSLRQEPASARAAVPVPGSVLASLWRWVALALASPLRRAAPALLWSVVGLAAFVQAGQLRADWLHARGLSRLSHIEGRTPDAADLLAVDRDYSAALASAADPGALYLARALVRRARGLPAAARADARRAFAAQPSPDRALLLGDLALGRRDFSAASWWYRVAVALHPRYARGYNNLAVARLRAGARDDGCDALWHALRLRPYAPPIRDNWIAHCQPDARPLRRRLRVARSAPAVRSVAFAP